MQHDTRVAEVLSAFLAMALALSTFTSPQDAPINVMLIHVLPEWAILNMLCAVSCLVAVCFKHEQATKAARFMSGCFWGTIVMVFGNAMQFLPAFWMACVMFSFDIYLVTIKGQSWLRSSNSLTHSG